MTWATWEGVGVDRMACAWLIRKWIDAEAEFIFLKVGKTTIPPGSTAFDIPDFPLSHYAGHCSFPALLDRYQLGDPILHRIAAILDEADTITEVELEPIARGLDVICNGIRRISENDQQALDRGALIYDALYAELFEGASHGKI